jgi:ABC-2 type transport system permease protein
MNRLISIEFQKLWSNRASRFLIISYFVILSFIALIASVEVDILGMHFNIAEQGIFNFPYIWHFNTYVAVLLKLFLAIVIVSMMANEYTYGTLKQNLIDGLSKSEFIKSKLLTVILFALGSTVFIFIMTLILGYSFSSYTEPEIVFSDLEYVLGYFVNLVAFFSFCLFIGILIKRSAFAIGFIFIWFIIEKIAEGLLWGLVVNTKEQLASITQFFPLESMSNLLVEPITRFKAYRAIESQVGNAAVIKDYSVHWYTILIVLAWTTIFMFLSYRILKKRDL